MVSFVQGSPVLVLERKFATQFADFPVQTLLQNLAII